MRNIDLKTFYNKDIDHTFNRNHPEKKYDEEWVTNKPIDIDLHNYNMPNIRKTFNNFRIGNKAYDCDGTHVENLVPIFGKRKN